MINIICQIGSNLHKNQYIILPQNIEAINHGEPIVSQFEYEHINSKILFLKPNIQPE